MFRAPQNDGEWKNLLDGCRIETRAAERAEELLGFANSRLDADDKKYLQDLLAKLHSGANAVVIVDDEAGGRLKYMLSSVTRKEASRMMNKVIDRVLGHTRD